MRTIWFVFFLSGVAGISYELVWAKYLVHIFGASAPAVSGTIAIFFLGLALGAVLAGRLFDRLANPLRGYGMLEIAIGVAAALVPFLVGLCERWVVALGASGESWVMRLLISALMLVIPATLIGSTFPAMAAVARRMRDATQRTSLFYGFNTLGAVAGCLISGFWWIPTVGLRGATWSMGLLNIGIGLAAISMSRRFVAEPVKEQKQDDAPARRESLGRGTVLALAGVTGFLAIATEALWVRALVLSFNGTVYVFAIILTAYLLGIGGGSLLLARLRRFVKREVLLLGLLYFVVALGGLLAMVLFPRFDAMATAMRRSGLITGWASNVSAMGFMALLAMLPSTLAMGASLPLLIGLADIPRHEGREAGRLYGLNTFGGIAGSLLGTFALLPWLGLSASLLALAGGYLALLALLGMTGKMRIQRSYLTVIPLLAVIGLGAAGLYPEVNGRRNRTNARLLYYHDAPSGTVGVYEDRRGVRTLRVNNYYGLSDTAPETVRLQWRLGHLPMLLHPAPERALLIGFATGSTLAAMSQYGLSQLDCVELHPTVIEMAKYFDVVNRGVAQKPGVAVQAGDGRRYLKREGPGYDVIVGDLYLPINAGVGSLFSIEHFRAARARLSDGGVFVAWLPLYQMGPDQAASAMRTFLEVFPDGEGWMGNWGKSRPIIGLVGWNGATPETDARALETKLWERKAEEPGLREQAQVQTRRLLSTAALQRWAQGAPLNSLDHPVIEYGAPRALLEVWVRNQTVADQNHRAIQEALRGATLP